MGKVENLKFYRVKFLEFRVRGEYKEGNVIPLPSGKWQGLGAIKNVTANDRRECGSPELNKFGLPRNQRFSRNDLTTG